MSRDQTLNGFRPAQPEWCGDFLGREQLVPGGSKVDAAAFPLQTAMTVKLDGAAAVGAVALVVDALAADLLPGAMLNFGGTGAFAFAPNGALAGAVGIVVAPLDKAIADNAEAPVLETVRKFAPSGTVVGRTYAERDAGTAFGLAGDADDEIAIIAFDRALDKITDIDLVRPFAGVTVKENFLPNFAGLSAAVIAAVRARYNCTIGRP